MTQLDFDAALTAKAAGLERVEAKNQPFVTYMRLVAQEISRQRGSVHIDDLRVHADYHGLAPRHPNAWGCLFRGPGWQRVGMRASAWKSNHGHASPVWRWIGA